MLAEVTNEDLPRHVNRNKEARLDLSALSFWTNGQRAFFDVGVFNLYAQRYKKTEVEKCLRLNENEKKRTYGERILRTENRTFTPLVFVAIGAMRKECVKFYQRLSEMIAGRGQHLR